MTTSEELDQSKKNVTLKVVVTEDQVSSDATLKSLNVAGSDIDLDTAVSTESAALEVDDPSKVTDADVKAEVNDANANATVAVANNVVTVTVTAQDGTTVKVYRVVLTKKAVTPDPEGPTDLIPARMTVTRTPARILTRATSPALTCPRLVQLCSALVVPWWRSPSPASPSLSGASAAPERIQMLPLSRLLTDGEEAPSITIT